MRLACTSTQGLSFHQLPSRVTLFQEERKAIQKGKIKPLVVQSQVSGEVIVKVSKDNSGIAAFL